jgi:hypothetical protein
MCFKQMNFQAGSRKIWRWIAVSALLFSAFLAASAQETGLADRLLAVVNEEAITLTDVRIAEAFHLFGDNPEETAGMTRFQILNKLIDRKLIIRLSSGSLSFPDEALDARVQRIIDRMGTAQVREKFMQFGIRWNDLKAYVREFALYDEIIFQRFNKSIFVSLKEIEDYYNDVYIPSRRRDGMLIKPMVEILDEIERAIKREKIASRVDEWIANLRREADILLLWDGEDQFQHVRKSGE